MGPFNARPFRQPWVIFDDACTDLYSLDAFGNQPPAGTDPGSNGLGSTASWNSLAEAYNLQANIGAPIQVSGDPDGLCDAYPERIIGNITIGADQDLYVGPINSPADGFLMLVDFDAKVTDYQFAIRIPQPWAPTNARSLGSTAVQTTLNQLLFGFGPTVNSSALQATSDEVPWVTEHNYLWINLDGGGAWQMNMALIPYRSQQYGR